MTNDDIDRIEERIDAVLEGEEAQYVRELCRLARLGMRAERETCGTCEHHAPFASAPDCEITIGQCMHSAAMDGGRSYWRSHESCSRWHAKEGE